MWMLMDFLIKLNDILRSKNVLRALRELKGEIRVSKIVKSNGGFDIPDLEATRLPDVGKDVEKEEFTTRMKALSEEELGWLMEVIPLELCLKKIEREVARVEEYKRVVKDISKAFE